ncbi:MAG: hypothetical protein ACP5PQ_05120 [Thermoproteota archaeon]
MPEPVVIVDYDPQWPLLYEEEKKNIVAIIGHKVSAIEQLVAPLCPN